MATVQTTVFCNICNVSLGFEGGAVKVHKNGKKHKEKLLTNENLRKVVILSSYDTPLQQEFTEFIEKNIGKIDSLNFKATQTIIIFKHVKSANCMYSKRHMFKDKPLTVSKQTFTIFRNVSVKRKMEFPTKQLYGDFEQQLSIFVKRIGKDPIEIYNVYINLYKDLQNALNHDMPGCNVVPFGSTVTGLSFLDSDVDCFVYLSPDNMKSLTSMYTDENKLHEYLVRVAKKRLQKNRNIFSTVLCVPKATIPIVKFLHLKTGLHCDVSFKGGFGIHNSRLITVLIRTDPRLHPLFMYIKYWTKSHDLLGLGRFSSHALSMLIIYYLQQMLPPILPPIKSLQENSDVVCIDSWNCGFNDSLPNFQPHLNKLPIIMLLRGFFRLYSTFNFNDNVICVFAGKSYKLQLFNKLETFPPEFRHYSKSVADDITKLIGARAYHVCIQDPFLHSRNVALSISKGNLNLFQQHCKLSCSIIDTNNNHHGVIDALLTQAIVPEAKYANIMIRVPNQIMLRKGIDVEYSQKFVENVIKFFDIIIKEILKSPIQISEKKSKSNVPSIFYTCQLHYNLWTDRVGRNISKSLEEEIKTSDNMMTEKCMTKPQKPLFSISLKIFFESEHISVNVSLMKKSAISEFNIFVKFFKTLINTIVTEFLDKYD